MIREMGSTVDEPEISTEPSTSWASALPAMELVPLLMVSVQGRPESCCSTTSLSSADVNGWLRLC